MKDDLLENDKKEFEENGSTIERPELIDSQESKKDDNSDTADIKVFNGLIKETPIIKKISSVKPESININLIESDRDNNNNEEEEEEIKANLNINNISRTKESTINNKKSQNTSKTDFESYFNDNKNLHDLNFISFGDCDSFFNNFTFKNEDPKKIDLKQSFTKKTNNQNNISFPNNQKNQTKTNKGLIKQKILNNLNSKQNIDNIIESLPEKNQKSPSKRNMSFNDPKEEEKSKKSNNKNNGFCNESMDGESKDFESYSNVPKGVFMTTEGMIEKEDQNYNNNNIEVFFNPFIVKKEENEKKDRINRTYSESKNFFRISSIKQGEALLVTGDDVVFNFPAFLLPKGAKLGETFTIDIKSLDTCFVYKNTKAKEIENIQKKYLKNDLDNE